MSVNSRLYIWTLTTSDDDELKEGSATTKPARR